MKISFTYSFADYEAINRSKRRARRFGRLRDAALFLLVAFNICIGFWFLGLQLGSGRPLGFLSFANIAIGVLIVLSIYVLGPMYRKWYLRQQLMEDAQVELEFDEQGLTADLLANSTRTKWPGIMRADEDETHYLLWINKLQAYSIPKRAFADGEEAKFRELVASNVKDRTLMS